jgi:hypothetical protein
VPRAGAAAAAPAREFSITPKPMKKYLVLLAPFFFSALLSCRNIALNHYSIGTPKPETPLSLSEELEKYSPGFSAYLCVFRDSASFVDWFRTSKAPGRSMFFDHKGFRIITRDSAYCSGVDLAFARNLGKSRDFRTDSSARLFQLTKFLEPVGRKAFPETKDDGFTCVVFWAKFMGRTNEQVFEIASASLGSPAGKNQKVNLLLVDMDMMKSWNTSGNMIRAGTSSK